MDNLHLEEQHWGDYDEILSYDEQRREMRTLRLALIDFACGGVFGVIVGVIVAVWWFA